MELAIINGRIWSPHRPDYFAQALLVKKGHFYAIGSNAEILALKTNRTEIIDARGRLVLPGFNDAHIHLMEGGFYLQGINLREARNEDEFARSLQAYAADLPVGTWITGGYWDHEKWPSKKLPDRKLIDAVVPDHPVFVVRLDWHIGVANSLALKLAHIDKDTPDPQGGKIDRDPATGEPTGILRDEAAHLIRDVVPLPTDERRRQAARLAMQHASKLGLTSVQGECEEQDIRIFHQMAEQDELSLRLSLWHTIEKVDDIERLKIDYEATDFFKANTAKLFADGSFGADTALLFEPYCHNRATTGVMIHPREELDDLISRIDTLGRQMAIHAIGDQAVFVVLDALRKNAVTHGTKKLRHRIEHAQMVREQDLPLFRNTGAIASVQPSHCIDDMRWIEKKLGLRTHETYRLNSFLQNGIPVAIGTDWTVEPLDPMLTIYAAVTREFVEGGPGGGWHPQERTGVQKAVELYTLGSAYAEHAEKVKGLIKRGYLADFIILSQDIFTLPPPEILHTQIDYTIVGGQVVFRRST